MRKKPSKGEAATSNAANRRSEALAIKPPVESTPPEPAPEPETPRCEVCTYYRPFKEGDGGECRFNPPAVLSALPNQGSTVRFPQVYDWGWCGRGSFKTREV